MRINEIASATEQMELWKLISTNVWQAIDTQQKQEAQRQQAKQAQSKSRKVRGGGSVKTTPVPRLPSPVPPNAQVPNKITNPSANPSIPQAHMYQPNANPSNPNTITPVKTTAASAVHNAHASVVPTVKTHRKFSDEELVNALKAVK